MSPIPWKVVADGGCGPGKWAVVKKTDNKKVSCHPTKEAAQKHVAALYANEAASHRPRFEERS